VKHSKSAVKPSRRPERQPQPAAGSIGRDNRLRGIAALSDGEFRFDGIEPNDASKLATRCLQGVLLNLSPKPEGYLGLGGFVASPDGRLPEDMEGKFKDDILKLLARLLSGNDAEDDAGCPDYSIVLMRGDDRAAIARHLELWQPAGQERDREHVASVARLFSTVASAIDTVYGVTAKRVKPQNILTIVDESSQSDINIVSSEIAGQGGPVTLAEEKQESRPWLEYVRLRNELAKKNHAAREEMGRQLKEPLNAAIREMPSATLEDKKAICDFVNSELEPLGLAVRCPNTGLPAKLKSTSGSWIGVGTFYFEVYSHGKQKKSAYSDTVPVIEVMDAYPPKDVGTHFQDAVARKSRRAGRRLT
jgi:hypothetical protein